MLVQDQKKNNISEVSYTGQTVQQEPETSDAGDIGVFQNYSVLTGPLFFVNTSDITKSNENEEVDEEAVKILEDKNYQAVLTSLIP
jgi:hypothetical protein